MSEFRTPSRGGNLVHRIDLPSLGGSGKGRSASGRSRSGREGAAREGERLPAYIVPAPEASPPPPREIVREVIREVVKAPDEKALLADGQARRQIDVLERRLAKMAKLLDQRDVEMLSRARRTEETDTGVASIYREVQGLATENEDGKQKKALMSSIFEANLKLREMVTSAPQDAD